MASERTNGLSGRDMMAHLNSDIPEDAHRSEIVNCSGLYKTYKDSGIVNDPNGWFAGPRDLVAAIKHIVYVSVESARIIDNLPAEITET